MSERTHRQYDKLKQVSSSLFAIRRRSMEKKWKKNIKQITQTQEKKISCYNRQVALKTYFDLYAISYMC